MEIDDKRGNEQEII